MIKQKIKERLEIISNELNLHQKEINNISPVSRKEELMLMNIKSEKSILELVLTWLDEESGSSDGMRSREEIEAHIQSCDETYKRSKRLGNHAIAIHCAIRGQVLKWVLNKQEDEK